MLSSRFACGVVGMIPSGTHTLSTAASEVVQVGVPHVEDQSDFSAREFVHAPVVWPPDRGRVHVAAGRSVFGERRPSISAVTLDRVTVPIPDLDRHFAPFESRVFVREPVADPNGPLGGAGGPSLVPVVRQSDEGLSGLRQVPVDPVVTPHEQQLNVTRRRGTAGFSSGRAQAVAFRYLRC